MLKLQFVGHLIWRTRSLEKTLMLEKIESRRRRGRQRVRWLDGIIDTMDISLSKLWETVKGREASHAAVHGVTKNQTWHSGWIATTSLLRFSTYPLPPLYTWDKTYHTGLSWEFHDLIWELNDIIRIAWSRCGFQPFPLPPVFYLTSLLTLLSPFLLYLLSTSISKDV